MPDVFFLPVRDDPPRWDTDTVADLQNYVATRIKWSLGTDTTADELLSITQSHDGDANLKDILSDRLVQLPLTKLRVLREAATCLQSLEEATRTSYSSVPGLLWNQDQDMPIGNVLELEPVASDWRDVTRRQLTEVVDLFSNCCDAVFGDTLHEQPDLGRASSVHHALSSQAFGKFSNLAFLKEVDLTDWEADLSALENILRGLGDPREWVEPWLSSQSPQNYVTGPYWNFWNWLILSFVAARRKYPTGFWSSRKQWSDRGYRLKEKPLGAPVFHFYSVTTQVEYNGPDARQNAPSYRGLRSKMSVVFNGNQVNRKRNGEQFKPPQRVVANKDVEQCLQRHVIDIRHGGEGAFYHAEEDVIFMPPREWFQGSGSRHRAAADYYATLLHEVVHWTGHSSRLARHERSRGNEELIAELGSAFLRTRFGMSRARRASWASHEIRDLDEAGHAAYISHWLGDRPVDSLLEAAYEANRACNFIIFPPRS